MRAVNLLPHELRPGRRWVGIGRDVTPRRVLAGSGIAAGVLALALAALTVYQRDVVADRQAELGRVESRLAAAEVKAAVVREAQAASAARLVAVREVIGHRVVWEDVLRDLARVLPANVWLQSLQAAPSAASAAPVAGAAGAPTGFTVVGFADSQVRVAQVLDRLALLGWLGDVGLQSSTRSGGSTGTPIQFTIGATLRSTGGR